LLCERPFLLPTLACALVQLSGLLPLWLVRPRVQQGLREAAQAKESKTQEGSAAGQRSVPWPRQPPPLKSSKPVGRYAPLREEGPAGGRDPPGAPPGPLPGICEELAGAGSPPTAASGADVPPKPAEEGAGGGAAVGQKAAARPHLPVLKGAKPTGRYERLWDESAADSAGRPPSPSPGAREKSAGAGSPLAAAGADEVTSEPVEERVVVVEEAKPVVVEEAKSFEEEKPQSEVPSGGMLGDTNCRLCVAIYCMISFGGATMQEFTSLLIMAPTAKGGMSGDPAEIGDVFSVVGLLSAAFQLAVGPCTVRGLGIVRAVQVGGYISAVTAALPPFIPQLLPAAAGISGAVRLAALSLVMFVRSCGDYLCFSSVFVLVNNSVPASRRGSINGLAMTLASIFKALGPSVGTVLFAGSLRMGLPAPLDSHLCFLVVALIAWATAVLGAGRLPAWAADPYDAQPGRAGEVPSLPKSEACRPVS